MFCLHVHFKNILAIALLATALVIPVLSQSDKADKLKDQQQAKQDDQKQQDKRKSQHLVTSKDGNKPGAAPTAESVAEAAILVYGGFGGRKTLDQIRKTTIEHGKMNLLNAQGLTEPVNYVKWSLREDNLNNEKIRADLEYPSIRYAMVRSDDKTFGLYNDAAFSPRADATKEFENRIFHGLEALLRYKENGSTLELGGHEKIMGVDYYFIDVTDKAGRKTRFYVSSKTYRVMILDYEEDGIKYRRKFYDYNYAQGTLVPFHTTLTANDKIVEQTDVLTVTFGQKVDDELFKSGT
jgi:type II secretory pathway pseudopilin PulG